MTDPLLALLVEREIERTTQSDDPVIQRALELLGQRVNPVQVVSPSDFPMKLDVPGRGTQMVGPEDPAQVAGSAAFRLGTPGNWLPQLFVNREANEYRVAGDHPEISALLLGGALAHEMTHEHEGGERAPYRLEADFVRSKLDTLSPKYKETGRKIWEMLEQRALQADRAERRK